MMHGGPLILAIRIFNHEVESFLGQRMADTSIFHPNDLELSVKSSMY